MFVSESIAYVGSHTCEFEATHGWEEELYAAFLNVSSVLDI